MNIQQSYRQGAVLGANPVELVIRLYERLIEDLRRAAVAIERQEEHKEDRNQVERRSKAIQHALLIIGCLQSSLDFAQGGKVAENLNNFYAVLRQRLLALQFRPSKLGIEQQITDVLAVRSAWAEVERKERMPESPSPQPHAASAFARGDTPQPSRRDWKG